MFVYSSSLTSFFGIFFSVLHVALLALQVVLHKCHVMDAGVVLVDICGTLPLVSGGLIMFGVVGAWITGYALSLITSIFEFSWHD